MATDNQEHNTRLEAAQSLSSLLQHGSQRMGQMAPGQAPTNSQSNGPPSQNTSHQQTPFSAPQLPVMWNQMLLQQQQQQQQAGTQFLPQIPFPQSNAPMHSFGGIGKPNSSSLASLRGLVNLGGSISQVGFHRNADPNIKSSSADSSQANSTNTFGQGSGSKPNAMGQMNWTNNPMLSAVGMLNPPVGSIAQLNAMHGSSPKMSSTSVSQQQGNQSSNGNVSNTQDESNTRRNTMNDMSSSLNPSSTPVQQQQLQNQLGMLYNFGAPSNQQIQQQIDQLNQFRMQQMQQIQRLHEAASATLPPKTTARAPAAPKSNKRQKPDKTEAKSKKNKKPKTGESAKLSQAKKTKGANSEIRIDSFALYTKLPQNQVSSSKPDTPRSTSKKNSKAKVPKPYPAKKDGEASNIALCALSFSSHDMDAHVENFTHGQQQFGKGYLSVVPYGPVGVAVHYPKQRKGTKVSTHKNSILAAYKKQTKPFLNKWKGSAAVSELLTTSEQRYMVSQYRRLLTNAIQSGVYSAFSRNLDGAEVLSGKEISTELTQVWSEVQVDELKEVPVDCRVLDNTGAVDYQESFFRLEADYVFCREPMSALDFIRLFEMTGDQSDWRTVCKSFSRPAAEQEETPTRVTVALNSFRAVQKYIGVAACRKRIEKEKFGVLVLPVFVRYRKGCVAVSGNCAIVNEKDLPSVLRVTDSRMRKATKQKMKGDAALAALSGVPIEAVALNTKTASADESVKVENESGVVQS